MRAYAAALDTRVHAYQIHACTRAYVGRVQTIDERDLPNKKKRKEQDRERGKKRQLRGQQDAHDESGFDFAMAASLLSIRIYLDYGQAKARSLLSFRRTFLRFLTARLFVFFSACTTCARRRYAKSRNSRHTSLRASFLVRVYVRVHAAQSGVLLARTTQSRLFTQGRMTIIDRT